MSTKPADLGLGQGYSLGWHDPSTSVNVPKKGLSAEVVEEISKLKGEPEWMLKKRLKAYKHFLERPMPTWGGDLDQIDFDDIYYYIKPMDHQVKSWDDLPEDIKNTYVKLGIPEAEREFLGGVTAQYECLRGSSLVWTDRGMVPIKAIEPGDTVFSLDETTKQIVSARVVGKKESGEKDIIEIHARGRVIGASGNHPFYSLRDERRPGRQRKRYAARWVAAEDLAVGDLVGIATDTPAYGRAATLHQPSRAGLFPEKTNENLCWFAGLYIGDGYLHHRGDYVSVEIAVDPSDRDLIDEIRRVGKLEFGLDFELASDRLRMTAKGTAGLAEFFMLNGLGGTAHEKRIPGWVFGLPQPQRLAFLAGYLDADGWVRQSEKSKDPVLTSANRDLLADARELAILCGIGVSSVIHVTSRHPFDRERLMTGYHLHLSGKFDRLPCRSPRRADRLAQRKYSHSYRSAAGTVFTAHTSESLGFVRIDEIRSAGREMTYDIEVEGHHNFVADGFVVHNSEVVYHQVKSELEDIGVFFSDMDTALREKPELVKEYFGTIIPANDNKFAALNTSVWSGGSFIYVPPNTKVDIPLQAYFRINRENMGQFERTLIIVDEGSYVHYVEGCSAPVYTTDSLHSAVVEIVVKKNARCRYTTIQNWSPNVYNLVTKRAVAYEHAVMEWVDGNIGSKLTMKYPSIYLMGEGARGEVLSVAFAGEGQHQDAGGKVIHAAPNTSSSIISKSVSAHGGRTSYRGLVRVEPDADHAKSFVRCDALILDEDSRSDTYPYMEIEDETAATGHEATVSKVGDDQLFYLMSRGIPEAEAMGMIVNGFIEPITKELPMEYAIELTRLIQLQMEGSVG